MLRSQTTGTTGVLTCRLRLFLVVGALASLLPTAIAVAPALASRQTPGRITLKVPFTFDYLLYLPPGYNPRAQQRWPLVLFLHGAGERGSDLELIKKHGLP